MVMHLYQFHDGPKKQNAVQIVKSESDVISPVAVVLSSFTTFYSTQISLLFPLFSRRKMVSPKSPILTVKQNQSPNSVSLISTASVYEQLRRNSPTMRQSLTSCSSPHSSKQTPLSTKDGWRLFVSHGVCLVCIPYKA